MVQQNVLNGSCLTRGLETQASDSTGFRTSLRQLISHLDESQQAYDKIAVDDPGTKCLFVASMVKWAHLANFRLLDYLEKINKGDCDEVLALDYAKLCNKNYWLRGRKKSDMMAFSDKPLKDYLEFWHSDETSWDIYQLYESNVCELADNLKKVKSTFEKPELYEKFMQQMKVAYADPDIDYEYEQMKEAYVEPSTKDYLTMQVKACVDFLKSGMLNNILSISNEEIDKVDEEKLRKLLDPDYKTPDNLKKLWAKLKKFIELKENVMLVPKRGLIRKHVLKHFDELNGDHFSALFRLEKLLTLMHQDMVKLKSELAKNLPGMAIGSLENTIFFAPYIAIKNMLQQEWFLKLRSDMKYDKKWAEAFADGLLRSEYGLLITEGWKEKKWQIMGYIIGCLKAAGVINRKISNDEIAREAAIMDKARSFGKYLGKESHEQPYAQWIKMHVDDYC